MVEHRGDLPLIVQSDGSLLLDVHTRDFDEARLAVSTFADLEKSPEHMHTYRISSLSLWNAASLGVSFDWILESLERWSRYPIPGNVREHIVQVISRFGLVRMVKEDESNLLLVTNDPVVRLELESHKRLEGLLTPCVAGFRVRLVDRGTVKIELIKIGYPVKDEVPFTSGAFLDVNLKSGEPAGPFEIRSYQTEAADAFSGRDSPGFGHGTVVMPCGSGKTIVGMAIIARYKTNTLILTTNVAAVHQWIEELVEKTDLDRESIGEYTGDLKQIKPVTIATYQIVTWRPSKDEEFPHFRIFHERNWGLIIYDEVHLLPAPVFRVTAEIQAIRRLGLTATLVREDGREEDVFTLVGPKRYDVPWKELEAKGWIAQAYCHEIRIDLPDDLKMPYAVADRRGKFRIAAENYLKDRIVNQLIVNHPEDSIMVIGQYLSQLRKLAEALDVPLITGNTPNRERERIYHEFRKGSVKVMVVSKVANFAIDLPDASVAIQVSGTFGSRQEEAQRLGRILRPKRRNSYFYTIVSRFTSEETFAANRQKFLAEQGYRYHIEIWDKGELQPK
ncbi:MAG: DEAD/DEAH box helicase [Spirochaetales bacterium]|nr:DEAD/DEAH box helicase [Spirochaetales bacterium]